MPARRRSTSCRRTRCRGARPGRRPRRGRARCAARTPEPRRSRYSTTSASWSGIWCGPIVASGWWRHGTPSTRRSLRVARRVPSDVEVDGPDPVGDRRDDLQPDPRARVARHRERVDTEVEHVLLVAGVEHGHARVLERVLAVACERRRLGGRVVAAEHHDAAVGAGPHRVGVLHRVAGTVEPGRLAVPGADDAVDARRTRPRHPSGSPRRWPRRAPRSGPGGAGSGGRRARRAAGPA